tara:strand:- start:1244 stop:1813 length:570 start_codon:yes stop_codon:yes gene_type:complete
MKEQMTDILQDLAKKIHMTEVPENVSDYVRLRMNMRERIHMEAKDTAWMHGCWVMEYAKTEKEAHEIDQLGWFLLYDTLSNKMQLPMSFLMCLSFSLSPDRMEKRMACEFDEDIFDFSPASIVSMAFDGARIGLWEMDDVKKFSLENYPNIPIFQKEEWDKQVKEMMGGMETDLEDMEIPKGGDDVYEL